MRRRSLLLCTFLIAACGVVESGDGDDQTPDGAVDVVVVPDVEPGFTCTADAFLECTPAGATRVCNADGNGVIDTPCPSGCNAEAGRCNACVPEETSCSGQVLNRCGADGLPAEDEACAAGCLAGTDATPAHCATLVPEYLPAVCDGVGSVDGVFSAPTTLDTTLDAICTGGVVAQNGGPAICVVRYRDFRIDPGATLTVVGSRALAIVADGGVAVLGNLDVSAKGTTSGPGGGLRASGGSAGFIGGGGAGFAQPGGGGGSAAGQGGAANGGATLDPFGSHILVGGGRPNVNLGAVAQGGGGGGAATLIACRGKVEVSGLIHAGGGGGRGGFDTAAGASVSPTSGAGGGSGGLVVLQGLEVSVTGKVFANGGGGGAGCTGNECIGDFGDDGQASEAGASGGTPVGSGGVGGSGGRKGSTPGPGGPAGSGGAYGGGGGSVGYFQAAVPAGKTPVLAPSASSPGFSPSLGMTTK